MRQYVTGFNTPGYLPEIEPRGPWNGWDDARRDLKVMIADECDDIAEMNAEDHEDFAHVEAARDAALLELERTPENPGGVTVEFMGRAWFILPAEEEQDR